MHTLLHDLRFAFRQARKNPGITIAVVFVLALGIAANSVTFTVLSAALLKPLPYPQPERLVQLWETRNRGAFTRMEFSYPDFVDYRQRNQVFEELGAYTPSQATLLGTQGAEQVYVTICSANFFDVLRVKPALGRLFEAGDDLAQAERKLILTYAGWQKRMGGDALAIGKTLVVNGQPRVIVGVLARDFQFAASRSAEFWLPFRIQGGLERRNLHWLYPVGRLKPGIDLRKAQPDLSTMANQLALEYPDSNVEVGAQVVKLREQIVGQTRPVLLLLMAAVGCFLILTCGNLAGLLLSQSVSRQKEMAIRLALGASRTRIVRQLLTESAFLSIIGGLAGAALSVWLLPAVLASVPASELRSMPAWQGLHVDLSFLVLSVGIALLTGIAFGLIPAVFSFRPQLRAALQESGRSSAGRARNRLRNALVVAEIALAIILLHGGGLMLKSLAVVLRVDPGFQTANLLTLQLSLPSQKYPKNEDTPSFHRNVLDKLAALPGVRGVATTGTLPLSGGGNTSRFVQEGHRNTGKADEHEANSREVSANYFAVMGIPLRAGRLFTDHDVSGATKVALINQTLADQMFPNETPVGKRVDFTYTKEPNLWQIVGIVGDENATALDAKPNPVIYVPFAQSPNMYMNVVVRTAQEPNALAVSVQRTIHEMDPAVPIFGVRSMTQIIAESPSIFMRRSPAYLIAAFGGLGLLLSAVGLYSLLSWAVAQRKRELGIRVALGAQKRDVLGLIIGDGMKLAIAGIVIGIGCAFAASRLLASFLFGVQPTDTGTFIGVCTLLLIVALIAIGQPAWRAMEVDPIHALREE